jgi:MHS family proline/betaine transporter-like MFS transporter
MGPLPALMSELFPVRARTSGLSICYAVGVAVFGGFAPFIHAWLIARTGSPAAPSFYVIFAAVISLFALFSVRRMQVPRQ